RYDGRGYFSVPGTEVPIEGHVLIVADSFDAMTSARPYRSALSVEEAARELEDKAGTQFHPQVAQAFAALVRGRPLVDALGPEALARGLSPSLALATAGVDAWSAWLRPVVETGSYEPFVADLGASGETFAEISRWALRRHRYTEVALASGGVLFLSQPVSSMV